MIRWGMDLYLGAGRVSDGGMLWDGGYIGELFGYDIDVCVGGMSCINGPPCSY